MINFFGADILIDKHPLFVAFIELIQATMKIKRIIVVFLV